MLLGNSATAWGCVSRWLHWSTVALIVIQIPVGFWMVEVYDAYKQTYTDDTWLLRASRLHHTLGFFLLSVAALRLSWRTANAVPQLPDSLTTFQRRLARATHALLYAMLFVYPLSGWAALSAYEGEFPIFLFAWDNVPRLVPQAAADATFNYEFFAAIHRGCWRIGALLLGLHVAAAIWHQFAARDGTLQRMWRGN